MSGIGSTIKYTWINILIHIYTYVYTPVKMYVNIYRYIYVCMCEYILLLII